MLRRNVLIFHAGALGDFIMSWPLAMAVGRIFAQSRVIYVAPGGKGKLADNVLRLEHAEIEPAWQSLWNESPALPEPQARMLASAAFLFSFISNGDDAWANNVRRLAPEAQLVFLRTRPPAGYAKHASTFLLEQLDEQVVVKAAVEQMLRSINDRGVKAPGKPGEHVLIHPGSGSPEKNWPLESYVELAKQLQQAGHRVVATIGEVERERWSAGQIQSLNGVAEVREPATCVELFREVSLAKLVITNDTGPGHLAGVVGVPTIAIFKSTSPEVWKPLGPQVIALQSPGVAEVSDAARNAI
jgi:ADP-heptose:LPS heptosyltransferase